MIFIRPIIFVYFSNICKSIPPYLSESSKSAKSSSLYASVIVTEGYHLLLDICKIHLFWDIQSIDVRST